MRILDLALGNPRFMHPHWDWVANSECTAYTRLEADLNLSYGTRGGDPELKNRIVKIHKTIGNAETDGYHIAIGHGATQLLNAVLAHSRYEEVYVRPPFFFRFPEIIKVTNQKEIFFPKHDGEFTEIVTVPSNPDNEYYPESNAKFKIHDLCYNWPQYGRITKQDKPIMIFSLAKATGHAGTRIGWALIKDKDLYEKVTDYMDVTTGGVSADAQWRASDLLEYARFATKDGDPNCFNEGKIVLESRWTQLLSIQIPNIKLLNHSGMFALIEIDGSQNAVGDFLRMYQVLGMSGEALGGSSNQLRLNIGCDEVDFDQLIQRLKAGSVHVP